MGSFERDTKGIDTSWLREPRGKFPTSVGAPLPCVRT
jgi:hypothetical protein